MLTQEEIVIQLRSVDPKLCAIFAARCSLRVQPLLIYDEGNLDYWHKQNRSKQLLHLLNAIRYATNAGTTPYSAKAADSVFRSATSAVRETTIYNANAAAKASSYTAGTAYAVARDTVRTSTRAAYAAYASYTAYAAYSAKNDVITEAIDLDLDIIHSQLHTKHIFTALSSKYFVTLPLWLEGIPDDWQQLYQRFKQAVLDLDEGFEHWLAWYEDRVKGVPLDPEVEKKWFGIPEEILEQGAKATNTYFMSLFAPALSPLNLVRAIFIGDGAVGKTSLIRRLHGEPVIEGKEAMTAGIEIKQWALPDSTIKARFWDFGGQVMSHSMHQFFLRERCLYILLVDAGSERDKRERLTANDRAEYWLEHIKAFGNAAPVMLVGNKADKAAVNLDMNALREKYPNILDFYPISCTILRTV
jgi:GTP-binding protein EngB required for normal cell division